MINLMNYILESTNIQTLKNYITTEIEKIQDENILSQIRSLIISNNVDPKTIQEYFRKRHLDNCYKLVLSIFNNHGDFESLQNLIANEGCDITSTDFLNASDKNIYNILGGVCKQDTLKALYDFNLPSKNNVSRGKVEVLLDLCLKDIDERGHGDVPTSLSGSIEIKTSGGMIKGQAAYNINACTTTFNSLFPKLGGVKDVFDGQKILNNLLQHLREYYSEDEIMEGLIESYMVKYPMDKLNGNEISTIKSEFKQFLLNNQKSIFQKSAVNTKVVWDAFLVTDFKLYQLLDKWDYLAIFNDTGNYSVLTAVNDIIQPYNIVLDRLKSNKITRITSAIKLGDSRYQAIKISRK